MLPLAIEDYKHRNIGTWLLMVLLPVGLIFGFLDGSFTWPLVLLWFGGIGFLWMLDHFKFLYPADNWISFSVMAALNFIGLLAFLASITTLAVISLLKGKEARRAAPFITIYLAWLLITFLTFFIAVALRL